MRVISGSAGGRRLKEPKGTETRPTAELKRRVEIMKELGFGCGDAAQTNWQRFFGAPERAASALAHSIDCDKCPAEGELCRGSENCDLALLAWLQSDREWAHPERRRR